MKFSIFKYAQLTLVGTATAIKFKWETVVNNNYVVPDMMNGERTFNSYNPPSVCSAGVVVFRGRSTGRDKGPVSGIFKRTFGGRRFEAKTEVIKVAARSANKTESTLVPSPNNAESTFNEFPSIPRVSMETCVIATRGMHGPAWSGADEMAGTTGVYVELDGSTLITGASVLGAVQFNLADGDAPPFEPDNFDVPLVGDSNSHIKFDVFPGSPSITDDNIIAFKGNYEQDGEAKTGVFYRQLVGQQRLTAKSAKSQQAPLTEDIQLVANSDTVIPGTNCEGVTFGSTAPPAAAGNSMVFVGVDDEDDPSCGGIYRAPLYSSLFGPPDLEALITLGVTIVPDTEEEPLTLLGEGLSYDGETMAFWGAWGDEFNTVRLYCPTTGNRDRRAYCNKEGDDETLWDENSTCEIVEEKKICYQIKKVPVHQGIFLRDRDGKLKLIAHTGYEDSEFDDFVFWNYSGAPPGVGPDSHGHGEGGEEGGEENDKEPPRFRSSAFISVHEKMVAFKGRNANLNSDGIYEDVVDGIYFKNDRDPLISLAKTGDSAEMFDKEAVFLDGSPMEIDEVSIEKDGLRHQIITIALGFAGADTTEDVEFGGVYVAKIS
jgi:hypothetical protein